jgi:hypothetical protein
VFLLSLLGEGRGFRAYEQDLFFNLYSALGVWHSKTSYQWVDGTVGPHPHPLPVGEGERSPNPLPVGEEITIEIR